MTKRYFFLTTVCAIFCLTSIGQNIAINSTAAKPDSSSILDVQSTNKGLLIPRMTDSQRMAIHLPATGLLVYQTNGMAGFYFNTGTPAVPNWFLLAKDNLPPAVDPGKDTTYQLNTSADSISLSGTATDKDGSVKAYLWSEVAGPNVPLLSAPGASSVVVKGLVNGAYVFQLMATDNNGATGIKSIAVSVKIPQVTSVVLQPSQNTNEVYLGYVNYGDQSSSSSREFSATAWTAGGSPAILRGIFKFDLSAIPAGATILSAKLTLYSDPTPDNGDLIHANAGSSNSMLIQRVISSWNNTITWNNQPFTDDNSQIVIPHTNQSFLDLENVEVTGLVKAMLPNANNGFLIKLQNEAAYNSRIFCSSKYSDATKHPKLEVQYIIK